MHRLQQYCFFLLAIIVVTGCKGYQINRNEYSSEAWQAANRLAKDLRDPLYVRSSPKILLSLISENEDLNKIIQMLKDDLSGPFSVRKTNLQPQALFIDGLSFWSKNVQERGELLTSAGLSPAWQEELLRLQKPEGGCYAERYLSRATWIGFGVVIYNNTLPAVSDRVEDKNISNCVVGGFMYIMGYPDKGVLHDIISEETKQAHNLILRVMYYCSHHRQTAKRERTRAELSALPLADCVNRVILKGDRF